MGIWFQQFQMTVTDSSAPALGPSSHLHWSSHLQQRRCESNCNDMQRSAVLEVALHLPVALHLAVQATVRVRISIRFLSWLKRGKRSNLRPLVGPVLSMRCGEIPLSTLPTPACITGCRLGIGGWGEWGRRGWNRFGVAGIPFMKVQG
jgi:hypothetical protein